MTEIEEFRYGYDGHGTIHCLYWVFGACAPYIVSRGVCLCVAENGNYRIISGNMSSNWIVESIIKSKVYEFKNLIKTARLFILTEEEIMEHIIMENI